jgi:hypothetical protein
LQKAFHVSHPLLPRTTTFNGPPMPSMADVTAFTACSARGQQQNIATYVTRIFGGPAPRRTHQGSALLPRRSKIGKDRERVVSMPRRKYMACYEKSV